MLSLKEKIEKDFVIAFKERSVLKKNTLGMLKTRIVEFTKSKKTEVTDEVILEIIFSEIKKRNQTCSLIGKETELYKNTELEIEFLKSYLPLQLTKTEMLDIVTSLGFDKSDKTVMGLIMKEFNLNYKGKFDNQILKEIIEEWKS